MAATQFVEFQTRDGLTLDALIIGPADFDPSRKYPVLCHVYGGAATVDTSGCLQSLKGPEKRDDE